METQHASTRAIKPDAQGFDEIKIFTKPRYKTSGLSGDEWRISGVIQFWRKGKMIHEKYRLNIESAVKFLVSDYYQALDDGLGYFSGEDNVCDQEGCAEKSVVVYKLKKEYCRNGEIHEIKYGDKIRMFCERHSKRGDCGLEDSDANYEIMLGYTMEPRTEDKKEAIFGGIINDEGIS